MFKGKVETLQKSYAISALAKGLRSKKLLVMIELLNHISHARNKVRKRIQNLLIKASNDNHIHLTMKGRNFHTFKVKLRTEDYSDYQSVSECLGDMYKIPDAGINYFIDAGANIGFFSVAMQRKICIHEAILIEPNPNNLELLKYNTATFINHTILPIALSDNDNNVIFELATSNTGHISGAIGHNSTDNKCIVPGQKLSSIIPKSWRMENTLLKMDIEGAEYLVIDDIINNEIFPKIITGEIHDYLRCNGLALISKLNSVGYKVDITGSGEVGNVCRQFVAIKDV